MSGSANPPANGEPVPPYPERLGHPKPLWMLFMTEFWERFAFYGIRWALVLYIVAQFHNAKRPARGRRASCTAPTWRWCMRRRSSAATSPTR